jgi:hypothetical protein
VRRLPYREEGNPPVLRPSVDVELRFEPNGLWRTSALIDTGAPITVFDYGTAEALLIRFGHAGAETGHIALLGGRRPIQFEYVDLSLVAEPSSHWTARVAFVADPGFVMPFQGLLGTDGFLDRWAVTFNKYYDYFVLQQPDDAPGAS